jgi:hypothetical protein
MRRSAEAADHMALAVAPSTHVKRKKKTSSVSPKAIPGPGDSWARLTGHDQVSYSFFLFFFSISLFSVLEFLI